MKRSTGLFLLAIGIVLLLTSIGGIIVAIDEGKNRPVPIGVWFFVGLAGGALLFGGIAVMRGQRPIGAPPKPTAGRVGTYLADQVETRQRGDLEYQVHYQTPVKGKHGRPSSLVVRVPAVTPTTLQFTDEGWFDKWCKRMGIAREVQTGDEIFDDSIYVRAPSFGYAEEFLKDPQRRSAILNLRNLGFPMIRLTGQDVEVEWKHFEPDKHDQAELVDRAVDELHLLAYEPPQADPDNVGFKSQSLAGKLAFLWSLSGLYAISFIAVFVYVPIRESALILFGLGVFAVVFPVFGWIAAYLLSGTSTSHDQWARLMAVGIVLLSLGSFGSVALINGALDNGAPEDRSLVITDKRISTGKRNSKTHYVSVSAWDGSNDKLEFRVSASEYARVGIGNSQLELTTSRGLLGIEWLKSKHVKL